MWKHIKSWFTTPDLSAFEHDLTREQLIQTGRIVFIDDEKPLLIDELKSAGFAVDHDDNGNNTNKIDNQIYDVAILDYHGVGDRIGEEGGLSLLKHIRRVSPRTRVIAYTSRSLSASESEFFRNCHYVLPKDMGLGESLAVVEKELQKSLSKEHLFDSLVQTLGIIKEDEKLQLRKSLAASLVKGNEKQFMNDLLEKHGPTAIKTVAVLVKHFFPG